jgi:phage-related protein
VYGLNFTAFDNPYWFGDVESPSPWTVANPRAFFPLAPDVFTLSSQQVLGGTLIVNTGDVDAYPVWTLTGPATSLTLQLGDRAFTVNSTLTAGQTLVIDTDPRLRTVTDGGGANRWPDVSLTDFDLWTLPPGTNAVTVTVTGGTSATRWPCPTSRCT